MSGHYRYECPVCWKVIIACRCPGPKATLPYHEPCYDCQAKGKTIVDVSPERMDDVDREENTGDDPAGPDERKASLDAEGFGNGIPDDYARSYQNIPGKRLPSLAEDAVEALRVSFEPVMGVTHLSKSAAVSVAREVFNFRPVYVRPDGETYEGPSLAEILKEALDRK